MQWGSHYSRVKTVRKITYISRRRSSVEHDQTCRFICFEFEWQSSPKTIVPRRQNLKKHQSFWKMPVLFCQFWIFEYIIHSVVARNRVITFFVMSFYDGYWQIFFSGLSNCPSPYKIKRLSCYLVLRCTHW